MLREMDISDLCSQPITSDTIGTTVCESKNANDAHQRLSPLLCVAGGMRRTAVDCVVGGTGAGGHARNVLQTL